MGLDHVGEGEEMNTETKQQHAPGPYRAEGRMVKLDICHGRHRTLARVDDAKILAPGYAEATAKLMAAAPDLLAACEFALTELQDSDRTVTCQSLLTVLGPTIADAIAKAQTD